MRKLINRVKQGILNEKICLKDIVDFREIYDNVNSKYSLVFSSESRDISSDLRTLLLKIIKRYQDMGEETFIPIEELESIRDKIGELEFSLKKDVGIYIVEFQDAKRELLLKRYDDAKSLRAQREEVGKFKK